MLPTPQGEKSILQELICTDKFAQFTNPSYFSLERCQEVDQRRS